MSDDEAIALENDGFCPICERAVRFVARGAYLRNTYRCSHCASFPRERALMRVLARNFPRWRELAVHESSPSGGASPKFARECPGYVASQYWPELPAGELRNGVRCENLERLSFADESFDLHVTQDVLEHVLDPQAVFREIARTLKPGGAHVFTVPLVRGRHPSQARAERRADGSIVHLAEPKYHPSPADPNGSLVTIDWGFDVCDWIYRASGLSTRIVEIDDLEHGIRGELNEVLITARPPGVAPAVR
jgi:SAM-dependent methyltransferase